MNLPAIKIKKSANTLTKLVGVESPAAKQIEKQVEDVDNCRTTLSNDTLIKIKKVGMAKITRK